MKQPTIARYAPRQAFASALVLGALIAAPPVAVADEGGVSFWIPGFFGSLAATPQQPGFSFATIYYHTSVRPVPTSPSRGKSRAAGSRRISTPIST